MKSRCRIGHAFAGQRVRVGIDFDKILRRRLVETEAKLERPVRFGRADRTEICPASPASCPVIARILAVKARLC
jgi:hypothetical protein